MSTSLSDRGIDPARVERMLDRERVRFVDTHAGSVAFHARAGGSMLYGVPMNWMTRWPGRSPIVVAEAHRGARGRHRRQRATSTSASATPARWPVMGRQPVVARDRASRSRAASPHAAERRRGVGRRGDGAPLRAAAVAVRADRDRREPVRAALGARDHRAAEDRRAQLVLSRLGRRDVRPTGRRPVPCARAGQRRPGRRPGADDQGRRDQRCRRRWRRRCAAATWRRCSSSRP